jgi:hypothetical protein
MKRIFLLLFLFLTSSYAYSEPIALSCKMEKNEFNLTIITQPNKNPKVYQNDKDRDSSDELGVSKLTNFSISNSEIKFDVEYESFGKSYPNGIVIAPGFARSTFTLYRTSGEITISSTRYGGLKDMLPNDPNGSFGKGICSKRQINKF